ncbi:MAG: hypothetical protein WDZ42_02295 [Candidatus Saccharimonadales bacterium]
MLDAYTLKKLLPRLLVVAIAIQASFFISALMVDFTNVIGKGLQGMSGIALEGMMIGGCPDPDDLEELSEGSDERARCEVEVGLSAAGTGAAFTGIGFGIAFGLGAAVNAAPAIGLVMLLILIVFLGAFLIVAIRDLLIIGAIVLAPLAFAASLLPATEKFFKFWWTNFMKLLLMYPFIILMIELSNIGAFMLLANATRGGMTQAFLAPFMALLMQTAAILSIYFAFKVGGGLMSGAVGAVTKLGKFAAGPKGKDGTGGVMGKIRTRSAQRSSEFATGARGGRTAQIFSGRAIGQRGVSEAATRFNQQVADADKTLEASGASAPPLLRELSRHLNSPEALNNRVNQLRQQGNHGMADQLAMFSQHAGRRDFQAAALRRLSNTGMAEVADFNSVSRTLQGSPGIQNSVIGGAAFANAQKGAVHFRGGGVDGNGNFQFGDVGDLTNNLRRALTNDPASISADSLRWYADGGENTFGYNVLEQIVGNGDTIEADALSKTMDGMNAEQREAIRLAVGNDVYHTLSTRGNRPPPNRPPPNQQPPNP